MSLCNTFRFFAVFAAMLLSVAGSPVPGFINHEESIATKEFKTDLENQESIAVELKSDIKRPNYINILELNHSKDDTNSIPLDVEGAKTNETKNSDDTNTSKDEAAEVIDIGHAEMTTLIPQELITEAIHPTTILNLTFVSQLAEVFLDETSKDENKHTNSLNTSAIIGTKEIIKQDLKSQTQDTINENKTEVEPNDITTIKLNHSTPVSLSDIPEGSTVNTDVNTETSLLVTTTEATNVKKSAKPKKSLSLISAISKPTWKKYTVIVRSTTSDVPPSSVDSSTADYSENLASTIAVDQTTNIDKSEVMMKSESAQGRILLQDAITSDIPSLEKLKSDLLSFPKFSSKSDTKSTTSLISMEKGNTRTDTVTFNTTFQTTINESPNTVSSKRGGYLDLSVKNTTAEDDIRLKLNNTLSGPFNVEIPDAQNASLDGNIEKKDKSQSELAKDAIKAELSKEEMLNDTAEIPNHHGAEGIQIETDTHSVLHTNKVNSTQFDDKFVQPPHIPSDENLSVRPINTDKAKNTILYPVNPNYKPLKKIEVQPAKPFVRDPDDNSWRNESLSSLGIVFKPKNSSKPFTQVLKNKTETEWNNLLEKDIKSEVPDLRVRLEQIAQKRKSKKKKIDSFGNVFYTDYEDNSSSEENTRTSQGSPHSSLGTVSTTDVSTSGIAVVTPIKITSFSTSSSTASSDANDVRALTTTAMPTEKIHATPKKEPTKYTTLRPPKSFNLFDYYETNDEEDIADYLNMAKIDLKKYTIPIHTTYTPDTSPPLPILYTNPIPQYLPGRKGTIQYFPPRTTKRPKKTKQNNTHDKINPLLLTDTPKNVLPIAYQKLTTPYDSNMYYTNRPDITFKENLVPKNYDRNLYLTTPPLTTVPDDDFGVIGHVGGYNRPNYVIKHYKDYMNEAVHDQDHSKLREFSFAEPAARDVAVTDFVKPTTMRDKTTVTEDYDYDSDLRKDLLDRFVANFNDKSSRLKSNFPVVYNNSVVHGMSYDEKDVALSRSYFRRPYNNQEYKPIVREQYDPNCENVTVELSPAYELHYYVPEQEEKQEVEAKPINLPVPYRL